MNEACIHRCRLMRQLSRSGLLRSYNFFSVETNEDGEPIGDYIPVGTCRGYRYTLNRRSSTDTSVDIPAHKSGNNNKDTYLMIPRCDLCSHKCLSPSAVVHKGQYIELDGEKREVVSVTDNDNLTQTVLLGN